ncbi:MAG TPA: hypothetical protein VFG20_14040 [Planctomycetaceae bacterium]|nr:hypothetical protein [Planctomycetaceae bacterium]
MRVVLCHHCWTWVFPQGPACPECKSVITLDEADPSADEMTARLGTTALRLGEVGWERPKLPPRGELWATSTGLCYWPLLSSQPNGSIVSFERVAARDHSWSVFSLWRASPPVREIAATEDASTPFPLSVETPSQGFLDVPGAAFFPRENLVKVVCRGRSWTLFRTIGRTVRFTAYSVATEWKPAWQTLLRQDAWRHLAGRDT